ncbi:DUF4269 domain-containing protein [Bradyrhizobium sp. BRP22]|uniref:DUF4269 domain-containing protein n=1 Tax=Bradyrhizobium sp. BRP22 TaxID=2793821 RepID=UPI001CD5E82B|nr:DUF4269 domain-containing protein [Bradyrhizobium sp. BRP22]
MNYEAAIDNSGTLEALRAYDPRVVGTFPLGLSVPGSDIDIICHAFDPMAFARAIWKQYRSCDGFRLHQWTSSGRPVVARFEWGGWPFEVFGDSRPVDQQYGWLHFEIEKRLLDLDDGRLRKAVLQRRSLGDKTEPAFAAVLGISGDPYRGLLELASATDAQLRARLRSLRP